MSDNIEELLTHFERVLHIVDTAMIVDRPPVDENGKIDPDYQPRPPVKVTDALEAAIRPSKRGVKRKGLTVRLWLALLILAAFSGKATVKKMHSIATGSLPVSMQRDLGVLTFDKHGKIHTLTAKQLYDLGAKITRHLDTDPGRTDITDADRAQRDALLNAVQNALVEATHVVPRHGTSYAVDESGVWAWVKGRRKPKHLPEVHEGDVDAEVAHLDPSAPDPASNNQSPAATHRNSRKSRKNPESRDAVTRIADEASAADIIELVPEERYDDSHATEQTNAEARTNPGAESQDNSLVVSKKAPLFCWFAKWGVKTHKTGKTVAYFGYALHVLIRVPDMAKGQRTGKPPKTNAYAEPLLIEAFEVTSATTDVVDVTLALIRKAISRGHQVEDLIGDRHYSYKRFERWAHRLWKMGVRQVLDLRKQDLGVTDYGGAQMIAGTPHCGVPDHLVNIERPARGASPVQVQEFNAQIEERQLYAMQRNATTWNNGGKSRWICPALNGTVGCPRRDGTIAVAHENRLPIVTPPTDMLDWCKKDSATIAAGDHMKLQQQEYWGTTPWLVSWNRRTYVEAAFGAMKNHHTGNIHRGYMCFTGRPLVTLALTAAVVAYNLRELEHWHTRATKNDPKNPLLIDYAKHPLHQRTRWQNGFDMHDEESRARSDQEWISATTSTTPNDTIAA